MDVRIRLFGRFELTCDGDIAVDGSWKPAKASAIVKILTLRDGRSMQRDELIDALWPDADIESATNSLYKSLHHFRQAVRRAGGPRDVIHLDHPLISLAPYVGTDIDDFRERFAALRASSTAGELAAVLAVGGEPLLPEDIYEQWAEPFRSDIHLQVTRVRTRLANMHHDASAFDDAIEQYRAILATDDLSEEAHVGLMRAYAAGDRRDLALRQYERCKELLDTELGTEPSPETEALAAQIRREGAKSRIDEAIDEEIRAGDAAMRQHAHQEAAERYRAALKQLQAADEDDERESALLLQLASATMAIGSYAEVAEQCRRAAHLAERAGAFDLFTRALVRFQRATDTVPQNYAGHRESYELIGGALARLPAGAYASRAMLLAASARPLAASARPDNERHVTGRLSVAGGREPEIEQRLREAVAIARVVDRREVLSFTLTSLRTYITSPDTLDERLDLTREMVELNADGRHPAAEFETRMFRHEDLLESGDVDGARIEARAMRRLGESSESSGILAMAFSMQATHATADGPLADARQALRDSRDQDARQGESSNSQNRLGSQLLVLRWHEGRIGEMEAGYRRAIDVFPQMSSVRSGLAFIYAETGQLEKAGIEFGKLTEQPVTTIPKDYTWWFTSIFLSNVAIALGEDAVARDLYALLRPYAQRNASTAGAVSFGSAELVLAQLAEFLGDERAAREHFELALAYNIRTRQRVWIARTRFQYAKMLLTRGAAADRKLAGELARIALADAQECGMTALATHIEELSDLESSR